MKSKDFKPNETAERQFARALKRVAAHAGHLIEMHVVGPTIRDERAMTVALREYSEKIGPWAVRQATKMIEAVAKKNKRAWGVRSKTIHKTLQTTVAKTLVGVRAELLVREQRDLIQSIPLRASERAQKLALEAVYNGERADSVAKELARSGEVSQSDATRIARTEVARSNSVITQTRAQAAGSTQYVWRNSGDAAVRESHRIFHGHALDGVVFDWSAPPTLDDGTTGHPGTFPNCRCYPEPFFPD